jgi:cyanate permease
VETAISAVDHRAHPRPGSWRVLAAYVGVVATSHILWISLASITSKADHAWHTNDTNIGLLISVGPIMSALFSIPAGLLADRRGYRLQLVVGGVLTAIFGFVRPLAGNFPLLLVFTVGLLLPQPFLINAVADVVNRHFPDEESATATGIGTMAIFLGITIGLVVTPGLASAVGVRGSQVVYAALAVVTVAVFWFVAPRRVPERLVDSTELPVREALRRVLRSATSWKLAAALFCGFGFYLGVTTWMEDMLKPRGIGSDGAGLVAGMITIAGIVGSVVLGALSDRVRRRKPFLVAAGVVAAPMLWLLGHLGSLAGLAVAAAVLGFFSLAALPVSIAVISEDRSLGIEVAGTGVGVVLMAGNLGGAAVVTVMGALKGPHNDFSAATVMLVVLAVAVVAIALSVPEPLGRSA